MEETAKRERFASDADRLAGTWLGALFYTPWTPEGKILADVSDIHIHSCSGRIDEIAAAKQATRSGMRAIVYKAIYGSSVDAARVTNEAISEWAKDRDLRPVRVFGSLVLGDLVGGLNKEIVKQATLFGAKKVWMPVFSAAAWLESRGMKTEEARSRGIYILKSGELIPEAKEILNILAERKMILSCGHLSSEETFVLLEYAKSIGMESVVVDHPSSPWARSLSREEQVQVARMGGYLNQTFSSISPGVIGAPTDIYKIVEDIRATGAEHCVLSSDTGQYLNPTPVEAMRIFINNLLFCGVSQEQIDVMTRMNPSKLLNIG